MGFKSFVNKKYQDLTGNDTAKVFSSISNTNNFNHPSTTYILDGNPVYRNLYTQAYLLKCYEQNPIVQSVINIKANAFSNMRFFVRDIKSGEETPINEYERDNGKLSELMNSPNVLQSSYEWLRQFKINFEVFGNGYMSMFVPIGFEDKFDYKDVLTINNLHSNCVVPVLTGKWLKATTREEIIKHYEFTSFNNKVEELNTNTVFHLNNANIRLDQNFTEGVSDLISLQAPISNIEAAYNARNSLHVNKGALGIITSEKKDEALGNIPLTEDEIKNVQKSMENYGTLKGQYKHIVTPMPLKYQKMAMSVKELMLFEEVSHSTLAICNAKGVPEELVRNYVKTGGLSTENNASEKRLYDSTIIPESIEFLTLLNSFLKTKDSGIELIGSFDHVKCLQANKKEEAEVVNIKVGSSEKAFKMGAVPYGYVMNTIGVEIDESLADKYVWDLTEDERSAIGINSNTVQDEEE